MAVKPLARTDADMSSQDRLRSIATGDFEDALEPVGVVVGVLVVLVGLTTLAGTPWTNKNSVALMLGQILGSLATVAIGAGLVWLARAGD